MKNALRAEIDAIKAGEPLPVPTVEGTPKKAGTPRKRKAKEEDENGNKDGSPKKRGRPKKNAVKTEDQEEDLVKREMEDEEEIDMEI